MIGLGREFLNYKLKPLSSHIKSCYKCDLLEYEFFKTEKEWLDFDFILSKKLVNNKFSFQAVTSEGVHTYLCNDCNQNFSLKDPDGPQRGFFKMDNYIKKKV